MKPFYHTLSAGGIEWFHNALFPLWKIWIRSQKPPPFDAVQAMLGFGTEPFDMADKVGALKVVDASTSHPTSGYGFWQRECDLWCHGENVPWKFFARSNRELERADLILCPSLFVRDSMLYNGIPEAKCVLNPYGVDPSIF